MSSTDKIKILRIINRFNIGGPTYNATFLTKFLSDKYQTILLGGLPEKGEADSLHVLKQYHIEPILIPELKRTPNLWSDFRAFLKIRKIIKQEKPSIVHTHASKAGMVGRLAAWSCGVPIVVHTFHGHVFHSYFGSLKTKIIIRMEQFLAKISTKIVVISPAQQDEIVGQFKITSLKKTQVIQLGFDLMPFHENLAQKRIQVRNQYQVEDNEIAVAIVGRLAPIKNHKLFLDAIEKILPALTKKVKFFIVGDGTERTYIEQRVFEINKKRNCIALTSWIKDIATFNAGMDLICLSSDNEGTPVSLIEAQAANLPVLTTDVGGVKDIVLEGETGYIVPKNDLEKYAEKLLFLIENENIRHKMSQNGWNYVQEKFSYKTLVKNMESMYDQLRKENEK